MPGNPSSPIDIMDTAPIAPSSPDLLTLKETTNIPKRKRDNNIFDFDFQRSPLSKFSTQRAHLLDHNKDATTQAQQLIDNARNSLIEAM